MANIKIYKVDFTAEKNFLVEDIAAYIGSLGEPLLSVSDVQYIKTALEITLKLDLDEVTLTPYAYDLLTKGNYAVITNTADTAKPFYYFIEDKEWVASSTVRLYLRLDTVNTFPLGSYYSFDKKTEVIREHKDRIFTDNPYIDGDGVKHYRRKIDTVSENPDTVLFNHGEKEIREDGTDFNWYIMYKATNALTSEFPPQATETFIMADEVINTRGSGSTGYVLNISDLRTDRNYYFGRKVPTSQNSGTITINNQSFTIGDYFYLYAIGNELNLVKIKNQSFGNRLLVETLKTVTLGTAVIKFETAAPLISVERESAWVVQAGDYDTAGGRVLGLKVGEATPTSTGEALAIDSIFSVDRTNTTILKIIKLPYAPFDILKDSNGNLELPDFLTREVINWQQGSGEPINKYYLKLSPSYHGAYINTVENDIQPFEDLFTIFSETDERNDDNESKLFHSDYYYKKFVYDSFSYPLKLEKYSHAQLADITPETPLELQFIATSTMNTRFLFNFANFYSENKFEEDYPKILPIARNNEVPLYNSSYLNYMRNGYNYDVKNKNLRYLSGAGSLLTGAAGSLISKVNPALAGVSIVSSLIGGAINAAESENTFNQKLEQLKQQSVSVEGSDDVDLMSFYTNNRAKVVNYKASEKILNKIKDIFYYTGYLTNETKTPIINTRKWFNFLQCEAVLIPTAFLRRQFFDDIKDKWARGITILHKNVINNIPTYDFSQVKANNEVGLEN